VEGLVRVVKKEDANLKVARENALAAIRNIAYVDEERKKGLYEHEGLITLLVAVVGKEGEEWKVLRTQAGPI